DFIPVELGRGRGAGPARCPSLTRLARESAVVQSGRARGPGGPDRWVCVGCLREEGGGGVRGRGTRVNGHGDGGGGRGGSGGREDWKSGDCMTLDTNPQAAQMAHESMLRTLAAQAEAIWPSERALLERYMLRGPIQIADIGCGSGEITARLAGVYPEARVLGV